MKRFFDGIEPELCIDYENRCGNCHEPLQDGDKYCRYCGIERGMGAFEPYSNIMECIYGPMPIRREHKCTFCRYEWETKVMVDRERYCPKCGRDTETGETYFSKVSKLFR